jgi:hypothetical protein
MQLKVLIFFILKLINKLEGEELKTILNMQMIRPRVFVMKPGDVMFVTGLARLDYLEVS